MPALTIRAQNRVFQAYKDHIVQFIQQALSRTDAVKYLNQYQEGSLRHWEDLLHALLLDCSGVAMLTFDEAAFIGREMKLTANVPNQSVQELIISQDGKSAEIVTSEQHCIAGALSFHEEHPDKRRPGRPRKVVAA